MGNAGSICSFKTGRFTADTRLHPCLATRSNRPGRKSGFSGPNVTAELRGPSTAPVRKQGAMAEAVRSTRIPVGDRRRQSFLRTPANGHLCSVRDLRIDIMAAHSRRPGKRRAPSPVVAPVLPQTGGHQPDAVFCLLSLAYGHLSPVAPVAPVSRGRGGPRGICALSSGTRLRIGRWHSAAPLPHAGAGSASAASIRRSTVSCPSSLANLSGRGSGRERFSVRMHGPWSAKRESLTIAAPIDGSKQESTRPKRRCR
jgi:hypothetical protein